MKVIDLLNKIANGEEILNKISIKGKIFEYDSYYESIEQLYKNDIGLNWFDNIDINLNTEIEIIEESKKIEKLEILTVSKGLLNITNNERILLSKINEQTNKLNEIIDYINKGDSNGRND